MRRNKHNLSNYKLLSCDQGQLIPCQIQEVLPGDTFDASTSALIRMNPLLAPVMHPVHVKIHHWFVPTRLLWDDWEDFITGGPDGEDASVMPTIDSGGSGFAIGSLADYLGVPTGVANLDVSALPFRAYALIFNEWYRDEDLVTPLVIDTTSGPDTTTSVALQNVAWEKDYFTSARPWAQKGPAVTLPLGISAPVRSNNLQPSFHISDNTERLLVGDGADLTTSPAPPAAGAIFGAESGLYADLLSATAVDVNDVRLAFALQRYQENRAKFGSRYVEYLRFLGVKSSDARLQRPEYLGGGKQTIQFSEVLQTAPAYVPSDDEQNGDVGSLKGHGIGAVRSNKFRRFFEEHGYVISLISVKPKTMYVQGLPRLWNRRTKEDYWQQELQHIGQQEILKKEIYAQGTSADETMWGYQDRYDEYRRTESTIAGEFRSTLLNYWHMARIFSGLPTLNGTFVTSNPTDRIYADTTTNELQIMCNNRVVARRMVDKFAKGYIY